MRFGILGSTEVRDDDGALLAIGGARRKAVLIVLALEAGRLVTRERLIDDVYGRRPPAGAANALQSQISRLRGALRGAGHDIVEFRSTGYRLAVDPLDVDAHRFERLTRYGRDALGAGRLDEGAARLDEALTLWRGPALADVAEADFARPAAQRLAELRLTALEDRLAIGLAQGEGTALVSELYGLISAHPLRERPRGLLMRALHAAGRRAEALAVFADGRSLMAEELGTDPSPELGRIHTAILRGVPLEDMGDRSAADRPSTITPESEQSPVPARAASAGVPAQITGFVGSADRPRRVSALLERSRLVTLTGPGGVGKTRLAIETARRTKDACFVDLSLTDPGASVAQAVLYTLGMRDPGWMNSPTHVHGEPVDRIVEALDDRALLLVLDNCEHVLPAAAALAGRLLGGCPRLRILATTQEALGITGEALLPVAPLPLPPSGADPATASDYPSVQLLAERATAARPDFVVDESNAAAVTFICRALDGLPLAIELAAARLKALPPEEVADRLDDRFSLLSRGSRTAAPKHRTLRAVVAWSWSLLDERQQRLARRFTVFSGCAGLDAVHDVCGLGETTPDVIAGLVEKSFIEAVDGARRYRMLSTIRVFAAEHLAEAGEQHGTRRSHAAHFLGLARTAEPHLRGAAQREWLDRLLTDHDNLHTALRWAVEHDTGTALELVAALSTYWWQRGRHTESAPLAVTLIQRIGDSVPADLAEEYVLCLINAVALEPDAVDEAAWDRAGSLVGALGPRLRWPLLAMLWPTAAGRSGRGDGGIRPFVERFGGATDPWVRAACDVVSGYMRFFRSATGQAEEAFTTGLSAFRALGDRWGAVQALAGLATISSWRGDLPRTLALTDEALEDTDLLGAAEDSADLVRLRAEGLLNGGDPDGAQEAFERAVELARRCAARGVLLTARCGLSEIARLRGDLDEARRLVRTGWEPNGAGKAGEQAVIARRVLAQQGHLAIADGDIESACDRFEQALVGDPAHWYPTQATLAAEVLAAASLLCGDAERAVVLLGASASLRGGRETSAPGAIRTADAAWAALGEDAHRDAYARGLALSRTELLEVIDGSRRDCFA
ncbi:BTAD domain-containing putative transcriptional regulator [Nocardiopsis suaedae]|uniref:BTAD domain-containing putative transcriptional regulator n=1 Tax=Nocardiopsis suaedae TaxID=3018444 RepID=A0ABT4TH02_9ACTN|nr:BTAD domain-containing putative transcriptional regulator [Nocardiopsis suaedae]MDA2803631.1 BTAD domain-containing putative transcriptional regulator [Nocardiopsis suaedae]